MYLDTKTYLPGDILTKVDRMSMATSLEVRVPILDHVFAEWVTGLPAGWKLRDGQPKYILRKLAERIGVPPEVLHRPKQGFSLPLVHWMRRELKDELPRLLLEPPLPPTRLLRASGGQAVAPGALPGTPGPCAANLVAVGP